MSSAKRLRACLMCSFVATPAEFRRDGCPNCDRYLNMKGNPERILECTTHQFDGTIAMINPRESWVAKWQRNDKHSPGVYAVRVTGSLPDELVQDLEASGVKIHSRDMVDE